MKHCKAFGALVMAALLLVSSVAGAAENFNWGRDITVVSREEGSGTRGAFVELTGVEAKNEEGVKIDRTTEEAVITNSTAVCLTTVAGNRYAMGYVSLGSLGETVKALRIDGAEATAENVRAGVYPLARPFLIVYRADGLSALAEDFIAFILGAEGQAIVAESGYVPAGSAEESRAVGHASGTLTVAGSSSVTPVMEKLAEAYQARNPNASVEVQQSDSTTGITGAADGVCDIGMASRDLKGAETEAGLTCQAIATDGIAVIVNPENPLDDLAMETLRAVYTGDILSWDEVGQ